MTGRLHLKAVPLAFCFLVPVIARADSLYVSTATGENDFSITTCLNSANTIPTASVSCAFGRTSAAASLAHGTAGVLAGLLPMLPNLPGQTNWITTAKAGLNYSDTVDVPSGTIMTALSSGTAVFTLGVTGTIQVISNLPCPYCFAALSIPGSESFVGSNGTTLYLPSGSSTVQITVPVSAGSATFSFGLAASAVCPPTGLRQNISCSAIIDYLDPVTITDAAVYDANGNLIPGATITSASGYSPPMGAATPEPSPLFLLAPGLLAVATLRRVSSRQS